MVIEIVGRLRKFLTGTIFRRLFPKFLKYDMNVVDTIESVHYRLSKLDLTLDSLIEIFAVLSITTAEKFNLRVWDESEELDEPYVNRVSSLLGLSRGDIRRLIKGQGLKINNKVIPENTPLSSLPWLDLGEWKVCVIKKGKNEFDFLLR